MNYTDMKEETDDLKPSKVSFSQFQVIMTRNVMDFARGKRWTTDEWNEEYASFRIISSRWNQDWIFHITPLNLVIEWAKDYYQDATKDTHDYWLKPEIAGK